MPDIHESHLVTRIKDLNLGDQVYEDDYLGIDADARGTRAVLFAKLLEDIARKFRESPNIYRIATLNQIFELVQSATNKYELTPAAYSHTITHNMGRFPGVYLVDANGNEISAQITTEPVNKNETTIETSVLFQGTAILI